MEAIILAGGFGTRLRSIIQDIPKPMAPIRDKPFLEYLLKYLSCFKITKIILCTGYKHEIIEKYFGSQFQNIPIIYSVETEPLGTGGAILKALSLAEGPDCIVVNGDTFFKLNIDQLIHVHLYNSSDFTIALKKMYEFDRYGTISRNENRIISFNEKKYCIEGEINAGVYIVKKQSFLRDLPQKFSLEKDFLEKYVNELNFTGICFDEYFVDIGIPDDYLRAQEELM